MKYAFAGNRNIGVKILEFIVSKGYNPSALLLTENKSDNAKKMIKISKLGMKFIYVGNPSKIENLFSDIEQLKLDYIIGIHYPYIIKENLLKIPKKAFLNLHPAYLPFNRGWHTPSWAILEKTVIGATLHEMSNKLDLGNIIHQKQIKIQETDTANKLYKKLLNLEFKVFVEAFNSIINEDYKIIKQSKDEGTSHIKKQLFNDELALLHLDKKYLLDDLLNKLKALTTNSINEACFYTKGNNKYRIQIRIVKEK